MIDEEYTMHMKVLKKTRKDPKPGDFFTFQVREGEYMFGRVIKTGVSGGGFPNAILIYIYSVVSQSKDTIPTLSKSNLLLAPETINKRLWTMGYFETVAHEELTDDDVLRTHCFRNDPITDSGRVKYMNEYGEELPGAIEPCGIYGLSGFMGIDKEIINALEKQD